jgi:hypothetical protein
MSMHSFRCGHGFLQFCSALDPPAIIVRMRMVGARQAMAATPLLRRGRRAAVHMILAWRPPPSLAAIDIAGEDVTVLLLGLGHLEHLYQVRVEVISLSLSLMVLFCLIWLLQILVICLHYV